MRLPVRKWCHNRTNYWTCTCSEALSYNDCIRVVTKKHYSYEKSRVFFGDAHVNRSTRHVIHDDEIDEAEEHSSHHEECKERIRQHRNIDESRTCFWCTTTAGSIWCIVFCFFLLSWADDAILTRPHEHEHDAVEGDARLEQHGASPAERRDEAVCYNRTEKIAQRKTSCGNGSGELSVLFKASLNEDGSWHVQNWSTRTCKSKRISIQYLQLNMIISFSRTNQEHCTKLTDSDQLWFHMWRRWCRYLGQWLSIRVRQT